MLQRSVFPLTNVTCNTAILVEVLGETWIFFLFWKTSIPQNSELPKSNKHYIELNLVKLNSDHHPLWAQRISLLDGVGVSVVYCHLKTLSFRWQFQTVSARLKHDCAPAPNEDWKPQAIQIYRFSCGGQQWSSPLRCRLFCFVHKCCFWWCFHCVQSVNLSLYKEERQRF